MQKVLDPFFPTIKQRNIQVYIARTSEFKNMIITDWEKYQLILFNVVQNAVKYNSFLGHIVITLGELIELGSQR